MQDRQKRFETINFNGTSTVTYADLISQGKLKVPENYSGYLKDAAGAKFQDPAATGFGDSPRGAIFDGEIKVRIPKK